MTTRLPPYSVVGGGTLQYFEGGGRVYRNLNFRHHCQLRETSLVVDGVVFAYWTPGSGVTAIFQDTDDDRTTEEVDLD